MIRESDIRYALTRQGFPFDYDSAGDDDEYEEFTQWAEQFARDLFDQFFYEEHPESWRDVENALIYVSEEPYEYRDAIGGFFVDTCETFRTALSRHGYFDNDNHDHRIFTQMTYRERWEAPVIRKESNTFTENPYGHLVGLEIELNDTDVDKHASQVDFGDEEGDTIWDCVHDGSLSSGSEFRLRTITNGDKLLDNISTFCKTMKGKGYSTDDTCSVHMHIDFAKANLSKLKNLIRFYSRYEQYIYDVVGEERKGIRFSQALRKTHRDGKIFSNPDELRFGPLTDAMGERSLRKFKEKYYEREHYTEVQHHKYYDGRYSGFNVHSVFLNGTLELRYLRGTLNERYIRSWVMFNLHIIDNFIRNANTDQLLLYSKNEPTRKEFFNWLGEGAKESYRKLQKSYRYEANK